MHRILKNQIKVLKIQ